MSTPRQPAHHTPTSLTDGSNTPSKQSSTSAQSSAAVALNMSWQLLIVILLPIIGGHLLDAHFHTAPLWTVIGMVLGVGGTLIVIWHTVQQLNEIIARSTKESKN